MASLVALLEAGTTPWRREWDAASGGHHVNLLSGRRYRGANPALLTLGMHLRGSALPYWCGFAEARALGIFPRKSSKAVPVLRPQVHQLGEGLLAESGSAAEVNGDGLEPLEGAAALELLEAPASGNIDPGQRHQWLQEAVAELDALQPALAALAERRADLAEEDHRRVREASLRSGESLRMRFRCEPSLPVDVIGLIVLLPAPVL